MICQCYLFVMISPLLRHSSCTPTVFMAPRQPSSRCPGWCRQIIVIPCYRHFRCSEPSTSPARARILLSQPGRRILVHNDNGRLDHVGRTVYSVGVADACYRWAWQGWTVKTTMLCLPRNATKLDDGWKCDGKNLPRLPPIDAFSLHRVHPRLRPPWLGIFPPWLPTLLW